MKFDEFMKLTRNSPIIDVLSLQQRGVFTDTLKVQLNRWVKSGRLVRLRRNLYLPGSESGRAFPSREFLAGAIYFPSYISLEYALSFYGIIPERTRDLTGVTARKTARFENPTGLYVYRNVKEACFQGFESRKDEAGLSYFMALPEKALADFLFFAVRDRVLDHGVDPADFFRLNRLEELSYGRFQKYTGLFAYGPLDRVSDELKKLFRRGS